MWKANQPRIEALAGSGLVLDVGGWTNPWPRADYVLDLLPYETRTLAHDRSVDITKGELLRGPRPGERFRKHTWIVHDICSDQPWPFPDKMFDFVVCSQVLEDIRDPVRACAEMIRVGRAGYIETPSRLMEHVLGLEKPGMAGYGHHRWLVEIAGSTVWFRHKPHFLHTSARYYVPGSYLRRVREPDRYTYLFWNGSFEYREILGYEFYSEAEAFIRALGIPQYHYAVSAVGELYRRARTRLAELRGRANGQWSELYALSRSVQEAESDDVGSQRKTASR